MSDEETKKVEHEGWDDIKDKKRHCTDSIFLVLLIAAWVAMTIIGLIVTGAIQDDALQTGNPYRLTNTLDYQGNICGVDSGFKSLSKGYYLPDLTAVCIKSCPTTPDYELFYCRYEDQAAADADLTAAYTLVGEGRCMYVIKTKEYLNRCIPDMDTDVAANNAQTASGGTLTSTVTYQDGSSGSEWFNDFLADVLTLQAYIFGFGLGFSTFVAFMYLYFLRIPGLLFFIIWGAILGILLFLGIGSILLYTLANTWSDDGEHSDVEVTTMRVLSYIGFAITALYLCLVLVMRKRIQLAIGIVKQASKALATMPTLMLLPVLQAFGICLFLVPWVIYVLFLASSGDISGETGEYTDSNGDTQEYTYKEFTYTQNSKYAFLYLLFCWFWTSEFILAFGQLVVALSFTAWYFTRDKGSIGQSTVVWALKTTTRYHMGSAAFGSLIIAIIKTIRAVIAYLQRQAKRSGNKLAMYLLACLQCCMWCLEKFMKFINKHAYILTAIYGIGFCRAAFKGFFLLLRNILRVAAVNMLASFVLLMGKILIPVCTVFVTYLAIAYGPDSSNVNGIVAPLIFTFLLAYWIGCMFLEIFGMGIETILFCFIADEEMFKVEDRFASGELMTTLQKTAQAAASMKIAQAPVEAEAIKDEEAPKGGGTAEGVGVKPEGEALM
ncbi:plasma-membrane choline transporter-domain-containing protein [Ochromonadaceae sp. CCMP2298]|nr:plasma-membrane choline transporter-domain-containing protein [Ochromonadaceae sp. CCMP2298]